jgi:hypothetical protein
VRRRGKIAVGLGLVLLALPAAAIAIGPPKVPPSAIQNSVIRDAALMDRALEHPTAKTFGPSLHWQSNGSLCGPASLVNVLRSLGRPIADETAVLEGSGKCWSGICFMGLTLDELAQVARLRTSQEVTVLRDLTPDQFRDHLRQVADPSRRYIVNFDRKAIFEAGGGHHSPIGGYLEDRDLVLVLDVNEDFKPWLVERERLFEAIDTVDRFSKQKRGLLLVR